MRKALRKGLTILVLLALASVTAQAQLSSEGTDFWLGFMENADSGTPSSLELFITSKTSASGTIEIFHTGQTINFSVGIGSSFKYTVSNAIDNPFAAIGSEKVEQKAIHVTSNADISLYAFNNRLRSADAAVVFPTNSLGREYIVSAYYESAPSNDTWENESSEFLVVATEDDTKIKITPSQRTRTLQPRGVPFEITLNAGEVYQVQGLQADLSGSIVESADESCKNFAVFGGNVWTRITQFGGCGVNQFPGGYAGDHLFEQMTPITTWGREYVATPFESRQDYLIRIIASEPNTKVEVDGRIIGTISQPGQSITKEYDEMKSIVADKPIQVTQYSKSLSCDEPFNGSGPGDPFMLNLSPNEQFLKKVTFNALLAAAITDYYVNIIVSTGEEDGLTLNNQPVDPRIFREIPNSNASYGVVRLNGGTNYTLLSEDGFIAYVYGFGPIESFGYSAGVSLDNLNVEIEGQDEQIGIIVNEACYGSAIDFIAKFEVPSGQQPIYTDFDWDFGDGALATGQTVSYNYPEPGKYDVTLTAYKGNDSCAEPDVFTKNVEVLDVVFEEIVGPVSVCPDVTDIAYSVEGDNENQYEWFIDGGEITSSGFGKNITVNWGAANDNAWLKLLVKNRIGCTADTVHFDVKINKRLEPALPTGAADVCFLDYENAVYSTPATNGSEYEWFVTNGTIIGGNSSNTITVAWDGIVAGEVWYREFNPLISDCEGYSDKLQIQVQTEIMVSAAISDALCFNDPSGSITVNVSGGKPGYTATWDNGQKGLEATGLLAGTHTVTITDAANCSVTHSFDVPEPDELIITGNDVLDVRCFQEANGEVLFTATGGTTPYGYHIVGGNVDKTGTGTQITGLPAGEYALTVIDNNGCEVTTTVTVTEPALLEPDLTQLINLPICPQSSDGEVSIDAMGGTPAYQFYWNSNPAQAGTNATSLSRGMYTVRIVDENGCEAFLDVEVTERFPRVYIPTAFSPNDDGTNDEFKVVTDCQLNFSMRVFNKWGLLVFTSNDIDVGWDGTFKGAPADDGVYTFQVFYNGFINTVPFEESINGTVQLVR